MKTAKELAQWVIDNRYPKNENEKVSDVEMYHELVESIEKLCKIPPVINCATCKHQEVSKHVEPCYGCNDYSNHQIKGGIVL
jgi:hypothetical protein